MVACPHRRQQVDVGAAGGVGGKFFVSLIFDKKNGRLILSSKFLMIVK